MRMDIPHSWECMNRTRIGVPELDVCECPAEPEKRVIADELLMDAPNPAGGGSRGAAYETYGSAGHSLREKYLAAVGLVPGEDNADG